MPSADVQEGSTLCIVVQIYLGCFPAVLALRMYVWLGNHTDVFLLWEYN
jgi:hypothetical protein